MTRPGQEPVPGHDRGSAPFEYELLARRVVLGPGAGDRLGGEVARIGASRVLVGARQLRADRLVARGGSAIGLAKADLHAVVLPHAVQFVAPAVPRETALVEAAEPDLARTART